MKKVLIVFAVLVIVCVAVIVGIKSSYEKSLDFDKESINFVRIMEKPVSDTLNQVYLLTPYSGDESPSSDDYVIGGISDTELDELHEIISHLGKGKISVVSTPEMRKSEHPNILLHIGNTSGRDIYLVLFGDGSVYQLSVFGLTRVGKSPFAADSILKYSGGEDLFDFVTDIVNGMIDDEQ